MPASADYGLGRRSPNGEPAVPVIRPRTPPKRPGPSGEPCRAASKRIRHLERVHVVGGGTRGLRDTGRQRGRDRVPQAKGRCEGARDFLGMPPAMPAARCRSSGRRSRAHCPGSGPDCGTRLSPGDSGYRPVLRLGPTEVHAAASPGPFGAVAPAWPLGRCESRWMSCGICAGYSWHADFFHSAIRAVDCASPYCAFAYWVSACE